jgi:hypothetical protein
MRACEAKLGLDFFLKRRLRKLILLRRREADRFLQAVLWRPLSYRTDCRSQVTNTFATSDASTEAFGTG